MKTFKIKGQIYTKASYPHAIFFEMKVEAENEREVGDKVWDMFVKPVGSEWEIKELYTR